MEEEKKEGLLKRKNVVISVKRYLIDAMGNMALGLFASLLIGTIFDTIGSNLNLPWLVDVAAQVKAMAGPAMGVAIAYALQAPPLVLFSAIAVGYMGNTLGGPLGCLIAVVIAVEMGKLVSKETKVDILVTPTVTILIGAAVAQLVGPGVSAILYGFGQVVNSATEMEPLLMGILVSVVVGVVLTLPISSAALCIMLSLGGLAGGAAVAGCCAQMVGFAVTGYKENGLGGLAAIGLGTSMLQVPNIIRHPAIWLAPTLAAAITGPIATLGFGLTIKAPDLSVTAGMGTSGLVGPIGVLSSMGSSVNTWAGIVVVCFVAPAILAFGFDRLFRKIGLVKDGDQKLDV